MPVNMRDVYDECMDTLVDPATLLDRFPGLGDVLLIASRHRATTIINMFNGDQDRDKWEQLCGYLCEAMRVWVGIGIALAEVEQQEEKETEAEQEEDKE